MDPLLKNHAARHYSRLHRSIVTGARRALLSVCFPGVPDGLPSPLCASFAFISSPLSHTVHSPARPRFCVCCGVPSGRCLCLSHVAPWPLHAGRPAVIPGCPAFLSRAGDASGKSPAKFAVGKGLCSALARRVGVQVPHHFPSQFGRRQSCLCCG